MKSFEEFKEIVRDEVAKRVEGEVATVTMTKNNSVKLDALSVKRKSSNISPVIYLDNYYSEYSNGRSIESIVDSIVFTARSESNVNIDIVSDFMDFNKIRDGIEIKLINRDKNIELLSNVPYVEFLDMAIVFIVNVALEEDDGKATVLINNSHVKMWGITKEALHDIAKKNSLKNNPAVIKNMTDIIRELYIDRFGDDEDTCAMIDSMDYDMYVMTNKNKFYGAATITYEKVLKDFANLKNCNLYILPSSIHECILIPEDYTEDASGLREMVQSVNSTEVSDEEVLSDNVYYYDRFSDKITIA